ncbi:MAG: PCRF domain-containing protein, partial [Candidatus Brocadiales bacterium]|nr:PCRF domain-containing protein [Candidatus Brocadiales bacterium]
MNDNLLKKLEKMYERYNELERLLSDPEIIADSNRYTTYIKEHGSLSKMVGKYTQLTETLSKKRETEGLLSQEGADKELAEMARDELGELVKQEDAIM